MMTHRYRRSLAVIAAVFIACGRKTEQIAEPPIVPPPPPPPPVEAPTMSLEVPTLSDTIGVVVGTPITIRVRRGTTPVAAADIRVTVVTPAGTIPPAATGLALTGPFHQVFAAPTSSAGELRVFVSLGNVAGQGTILIDAPSLALRDSARFTVNAGRLAKWTALRDTSVFTGNTLKLPYELFDRGGNAVVETPQVVSMTGLSANAAIGVFTADVTVQRGRVILRTSLRSDTVEVSVVPRDTVVYVWHQDRNNRLVGVGLDGAIVRTYGQALPSGGYSPSLSTDGLSVVSDEGQGYGGAITNANLYIADTTSVARRAVGGSGAKPTLRYRGVFFRSGGWILFQSQTPSDSSSVWRIRSDGSGQLEQLIARDASQFIYSAFPFPDGRSVAVAMRTAIYRVDVATRQVSQITTSDFHAAIAVSPSGDRIAWTDLAYNLYVVNADGTGRRLLATNVGAERPAWTRDGRYLVIWTGSDVSSGVVDVATGIIVPLWWNRWNGITIPFQEPGGRP